MTHNVWPEPPRYTPLRTEPSGSSYRKYLDALKLSFNGRCGYCGTSIDCVTIHPEIDHFMPQNEIKKLPISDEYKKTLINDTLGNLIYACPACNRAKSGDWVGGPPVDMDFVCVHCQDEQGYVHPCCPDYEDHLRRDHIGRIRAKTPVGSYMLQQLNLWRVDYRILWLREQIKANLKKLCAIECDSKKNKKIKELMFRYLHELNGS